MIEAKSLEVRESNTDMQRELSVFSHTVLEMGRQVLDTGIANLVPVLKGHSLPQVWQSACKYSLKSGQQNRCYTQLENRAQ